MKPSSIQKSGSIIHTSKLFRVQKMLLNKAMRVEFVNKVMSDVKTDVDEKPLHDAVMAEAIAALPEAVKSLYLDPKTAPYIKTQQVSFAGLYFERPNYHREYYRPYASVESRMVPSGYDDGVKHFEPSEKLKKLAASIQREGVDKVLAKDSLRIRMEQMVATCKTREALEEMFPELTKYIPKPAAKGLSSQVPAVAIKDFMKELSQLGVPTPAKQKQKGEKVAA